MLGNIVMLSEGRAGIDSLYSLKDGQLRLELPKEIYEKVGLVGETIRDAGRKHVKARYGKCDLKPEPSLIAHRPSNRARSSTVLDGARQERIREDRLGLQERAE
ncbi:MAG: hypothetical protein LQ344_004097 [Seirophora lacunosa]|nr:MAG: hypothetical protein LQ344_004097 [Seirophora lacunosa]